MPLVIRGAFAVVVDGLFERLERIHRLLEHLHHGDAAHVFGAGFRQAVERGLVFLHDAAVLAAHHREHGRDRYDGRHENRQPHAPVEHEQQDDGGDEHHGRARDVGQVVREQRLGFGRRPVDAAAQQA